MPRPPKSTGYERLAQADQLESDSENEDYDQDSNPLISSYASLQPRSAPRFAPVIHPGHRSGLTSPDHNRPKFRQRLGSNSGVDIKAINARLERWADEIASRFKRGRSKSHGAESQRLEIHHSVFQAPDGVHPVTALSLPGDVQEGVMSKVEFETIVENVRRAIRQEIHPSMISQGSSGSYFARNPDGKIVGVFKPKDEEPYAAGNPKWNKWIHRNLFPCFFGRACLIPNLSYVSEAAAYVLDCQLRTNMVPYTDVVWLASKSFHYPYWDRRNFRKKRKALPPKPGSFQVFLKGFKDANVFLRENPWPDQYWAGFRTNDANRSKNSRTRWTDNCRPGSRTPAGNGDDSDAEEQGSQSATPDPGRFAWTEALKQNFREELEKLVILDYIMRNTDRGLDNWMVKIDQETQQVSLVSEPIQLSMDSVPEDEAEHETQNARPIKHIPPTSKRASNPYEAHRPMNAASERGNGSGPRVTIGAIDNSLSWPWKHPDAWRSYPFGWLFLPVDLIGRPFSQKTRDHFLPLLTSTAWWSQTQTALRKVFQLDEDFKERMFARQIAVMKGQAWNVVEALKQADHGPLELTRRTKVCVWDDLVDVPVAVPMRVTSSEIRRNPKLSMSMDEGDLANSVPTNQPQAIDDLLGMASAPADMPHPGRFGSISPNLVAENSGAESLNESRMYHGSESKNSDAPGMNRPTLVSSTGSKKTGTRASYHEGYQQQQQPQPHQQRRFSSAATHAARRNSNSIAQAMYGTAPDYFYGDDIEGDLGYATAEGQMGNLRKVIVERLEPVKTKNPVFTCW